MMPWPCLARRGTGDGHRLQACHGIIAWTYGDETMGVALWACMDVHGRTWAYAGCVNCNSRHKQGKRPMIVYGGGRTELRQRSHGYTHTHHVHFDTHIWNSCPCWPSKRSSPLCLRSNDESSTRCRRRRGAARRRSSNRKGCGSVVGPMALPNA